MAARRAPGEIVVRVEDLVVGYLPGRGAVAADGEPATEPRVVARAPFLAAQRGDRIGIVGPNGAGKTTLLRTIAGELPPLDGTLTLRQRRPARLPRPAPRRGDRRATTVLDALLGTIPVTPGEARSYLARFLFRGDDVFKEVRSLSGGERSRLELALLGIQPSNLLLLDEPTNHLDIPAREAIEAFMRESPATLLVVSHDRRLLETVCDRLWVVDDGQAVGVRRRLPRVARGGRRWLDRRKDRRSGCARRPRSARPRLRHERALSVAAGRAASGDGRRARRAPPARRPRREPGRGSRSCRRMRIGARRRRSTPS